MVSRQQAHLRGGDVKKRGKHPPPEPRTADEFLEAGVEFEEAGEKWRAGDTAKSSRFFLRALGTYENGLRLFPNSSYLAYNRARLQFELAEQPRFVQELSQTQSELLEKALEYGRYSLQLNAEDADAIFNVAQILVSSADYLLEEIDESHPKAVGPLKEAIDLFEKCYHVQQATYTKQQEEYAAIDPASDPQLPNATESDARGGQEEPGSPAREAWAEVVEPLTPDTLMDTCLAQMEALNSLLPLAVSNRDSLAELQSVYDKVSQRASSLSPSASEEHQQGVLRVDAAISASFVTEAFKLGIITVQEYSAQVESKCSYPGVDQLASSLMSAAEQRTKFCDTTIHLISLQEQPGYYNLSALRWHHFSHALEEIGAAARLPSDIPPWKIHMRRAEVELLRAMMGTPPVSFAQAVKNRQQLLNNAEIYFRGAKNHAHAANANEAEHEMAEKEAVVQMLRNQRPEDLSLKSMYDQMKEDGLVP